jgi:hypothetical protein
MVSLGTKLVVVLGVCFYIYIQIHDNEYGHLLETV